MADRRTTAHDGDVGAFLASVPDDRRREDAEAVVALMREVIEALQGEFMIDSRPGAGSRLQVSVPLRLPDPVSRYRQAWSQELEPALDSVR